MGFSFLGQLKEKGRELTLLKAVPLVRSDQHGLSSGERQGFAFPSYPSLPPCPLAPARPRALLPRAMPANGAVEGAKEDGLQSKCKRNKFKEPLSLRRRWRSPPLSAVSPAAAPVPAANYGPEADDPPDLGSDGQQLSNPRPESSALPSLHLIPDACYHLAASQQERRQYNKVFGDRESPRAHNCYYSLLL